MSTSFLVTKSNARITDETVRYILYFLSLIVDMKMGAGKEKSHYLILFWLTCCDVILLLRLSIA